MTYRISHSFTVMALATSLGMAGGIRAQDRDRADRHDEQQARRYEDTAHHDSHEWNEQEERAYRRYLEERHEKYRDFARLNKKEQSGYWKWRHEHPDEDRR